MSNHSSKRINCHSFLFWVFPLLLALAIAGVVYYFQPMLKNFVDHLILPIEYLFL